MLEKSVSVECVSFSRTGVVPRKIVDLPSLVAMAMRGGFLSYRKMFRISYLINGK